MSNESGEILRMLNGSFDAYSEHDLDLYPPDLRPEIDALNDVIYPNLNNGVYEAGFSQNQAAYEAVCANVFASARHARGPAGSESRYLVGDVPTEADWRLFPTLVRFDTVYYLHFNCNLRRVVDYPNLWGYARDLYQLPGIAATVDMAQIKRHYYTTHPMINPTRIVPPRAGDRLPRAARQGLSTRRRGLREAAGERFAVDLPLEDLPRRPLGQLVDEDDVSRVLVRGDALASPVADRVRAGPRPGARDHERDHLLTHGRAGTPTTAASRTSGCS